MGDVIQYQENKRVNSITLVGADTADVARDQNHNVTLILKSDNTKEDKIVIDANQLKDNQPYLNIVRENGQTYLVLFHDNTKADKADLENIPTNANLDGLRKEIEKRAYKIESGTPELLEVAEQEETTVLRVLPDGNKIETILSSGELVEITKDGTTYTIEVLADPNKLNKSEFDSYLESNDFASQIGDILNLIDQLSSRLDNIEPNAQANREIATEAEALAGTVNDKDMTPLRVMQVIESMLAPININLENHLSDNIKHITQAEREKWNSVEPYTLESSDGSIEITQDEINKTTDLIADIPLATTTSQGLMSKEDKEKIDNLGEVDVLTSESTSNVTDKTLTAKALKDYMKATSITTNHSAIADIPTASRKYNGLLPKNGVIEYTRNLRTISDFLMVATNSSVSYQGLIIRTTNLQTDQLITVNELLKYILGFTGNVFVNDFITLYHTNSLINTLSDTEGGTLSIRFDNFTDAKIYILKGHNLRLNVYNENNLYATNNHKLTGRGNIGYFRIDNIYSFDGSKVYNVLFHIVEDDSVITTYQEEINMINNSKRVRSRTSNDTAWTAWTTV